MTETLLAFLGLMIVMLLSLNQSREVLQVQRDVTEMELEVIAHAMASEKMNYILNTDFDMNTQNGLVNLENQDSSLLTQPNQFPNGWDCAPGALNEGEEGEVESPCDDVDDFNGMQPLIEHFAVGSDTLQIPFSITAKVYYVDANGDSTSTRTWVKEVQVIVEQAEDEGNEVFLRHPIVLTRRISPKYVFVGSGS